MDKKLDELIARNFENIAKWTDIINEHNTVQFTDKYTHDICREAANTLAGISELFFKYSGVKDKFDNDKFYQNLYGPTLKIESLKTKSSYTLGIDEKGIFLNTYFRNPENLRYMDDNFWSDLLTLSSLGAFDHVENEKYGKDVRSKYHPLFNNSQSAIYKIALNYFVGINERENHMVLGDLQVTWSNNYALDEIIANGCKVFKILYKLNYSLWKVSDLKKTSDPLKFQREFMKGNKTN